MRHNSFSMPPERGGRSSLHPPNPMLNVFPRTGERSYRPVRVSHFRCLSFPGKGEVSRLAGSSIIRTSVSRLWSLR